MEGDRTLGRARGRCVLVNALNAPPALHTGWAVRGATDSTAAWTDVFISYLKPCLNTHS